MLTYAETILTKSGILFSESGFHSPHDVSFTKDVNITARFNYNTSLSSSVEERLTNRTFLNDTVGSPALDWVEKTDQTVIEVSGARFLALTGRALADRIVRNKNRISVASGDRLTFSATGLLQEVRGTGAGYIGIEMYDDNGELMTVQGTTLTKVMTFTLTTSATYTSTYVIPGGVSEIVYVAGYEKNGQEGNVFRVTNLSLKTQSELRFGISPRFLNSMLHLRGEVQERIDGTFFRIVATHFGEERLLKQVRIDSLIPNQSYDLKAKNTGTSYWFYLNDVLIGQVEYGDTTGGGFAIQGIRGLLCTDLVVSVEQASEWIYSPAEGGLTYIEDAPEGRVVTLRGNAVGGVSKVRQAVALTAGAHVLTGRFKGTGTIRIGTNVKEISAENGFELIEWAFTAVTKTELMSIETDKSLQFYEIQVERGEFYTGYMATTEVTTGRDASTFSIPTDNNLEEQEGTLQLTVSPTHTMTKDALIMKVGLLELSYLATKRFSLKLGSVTLLTEVREFTAETTLTLSWSEDYLSLYREGDAAEQTSWVAVTPFNARKIAFTNIPLFDGHVKRLIVWSQPTHPSDVIRMNESRNREAVIYDTTFSTTISTKKKNFVESTLAPKDGSPILVEDAEGLLTPTYFFDTATGEYRNYHEEEFYYRGEDTWELTYQDIDKKFFDPTIDTTDGIRFEEFYLEDGTVHFLLDEEQRKQWIGKTFMIRYQRDRSYYVDYNKGAIDSYRLYLAQEKGDALEVTQEGNRFSNRRLVKEVDLNPIVNPRHEGFMYITHKDQAAQSFRIEASSVFLHADGVDSADIIIEAIDAEGVEVLSPYLNVYVIGETQTNAGDLGVITPVVNWDTLKSRNAAGRSYFKYHAPFLPDTEGRTLKKAYIVVEDRKQGIGAQVPIFLKPAHVAKEGRVELAAPGTDTVFEYLSRYMDKNRNDVVVDNKPQSWKAGVVDLTTTTDVNTLVRNMRRLQMNTMRINVAVDVASVTSSTVSVASALKTKLTELLNALATEKWNIILSPKVVIATGESAQQWAPTSRSTWQTNWTNLMKTVFIPYATTSDATGIVIGKEFSLLENETTHWTTILNTLYPLFKGNLIYETASWVTNVSTPATLTAYETKLATPWFSHPNLHVLSVSVNFPLTTTVNPSYSELTSALTGTTINANQQNIYEEIKNFNRKHDKPVWFGEFGVAALDGGASAPRSITTSSTPNTDIQGSYFNAYMDRFLSEDWFVGAGWCQIGDEASVHFPAAAAIEASLASQQIKTLDEELGVKLSYESQLTKYDVLDMDQNGQIARSELDWLIKNQYDSQLMRTKQMQLLEREDFE